MKEALKIEWIKIGLVKSNPANPRVIKDDKFKKLVKSIQDFPQMLELRPIVVNENNVVLGGNMRLKALQELKYKEVPIVKASDLTDEQQKEFIIKDNVGFGEWDWDVIADSWDYEKITEWGLDVPGINLDETFTENNEYNFQNKVTIEFKTFEEAQVYFEKTTKEGLKAKLS